MKLSAVQLCLLVIVAMTAGSLLSYWLVTRLLVPAEPQAGPRTEWPAQPPVEASSSILAAQPAAPGNDAELDAAIARAREARKNGTLTPLATTPAAYARQLGRLNHRIHVFTVRNTPPPAEGPARETWRTELDAITADLANLLSDEALVAQIDDSTPAALAAVQAQLAAGSLELGDAVAAKIETLLIAEYARFFPEGFSSIADADDAKLSEMTDALTTGLMELLTPEQRERFDALGADLVLFGLRTGE